LTCNIEKFGDANGDCVIISKPTKKISSDGSTGSEDEDHGTTSVKKKMFLVIANLRFCVLMSLCVFVVLQYVHNCCSAEAVAV